MAYTDYLRAIRRFWWMIVAAIVFAGLGATYITVTTPKQYATTVTFFVQTPSDQLAAAAQGDTFGQKRVNSYVQLTNTDRLLKPVLAETRVPLSTTELSSELSASGDINTVLLTVTVTDPTLDRSKRIASSVANQFVKLVDQLEKASSGGNPTVRLELVSGPTANLVPVQPRPVLNYGLAVLLGLLVGLGLAILRELRDTTVRSTQGAERATGAAVIATIAFDDSAKASPLIVDTHAQSLRAEAFRQLRTNLEFVDVDSPAKVIVITSSLPGEGKSSTATNLAVIQAEAGRRVLLIEGDLRRPRVAEYLGLEGNVGLTNVLAGQVEVSDVLQPWGRGGLTVLASGSIPPNPSELLGSKAMVDLLNKLTQTFDIVLVDSPPLLPVTDAAILAAHADGAILVIRHGLTTRHQVAMAANALDKVDARLLGCVLNMVPTRGVDAYGYGYGNYESVVRSMDDDQGDAFAVIGRNLIDDRPAPLAADSAQQTEGVRSGAGHRAEQHG